MEKIIKNMIRCKKCGDIIESTHCHDFKRCSCGAVAVDGGKEYIRRCGHAENWEELSECKPMIKILFVCHGNICRSPMAEFVMKDLVQREGLAERFEIASAATSTEEIGSPVYPPVRRLLNAHGIDCSGKTARQLTRADYDRYDWLIGMDRANFRNMHRICGGDEAGKIHLLLDFTDRGGEVADPWYTGNFDATWRDAQEGCRGLLHAILSEEN